jgi:dTDP-glucose 4,6-dehydratase
MKLLVTGGAGFIGSNFINYWLKKYKKDIVINLDLMTYCANPLTVEMHKKQFGKRYEFVKGDIKDEKLVHQLVKRVELVVHFAAESHVDRSVNSPCKFIETNVLGTQILLEAAKEKRNIRFHHISTDEVFGTLKLNSTEKFNEQTCYAPRSPYSASKAAADHLVRAYFETYNLPITITNCSNNYGPFQFPEKVIPLYIIRLMADKTIPIYGRGKAIRDYLYIEDHCKAIELVIKKGKIGESYCVGGDCERNTNQIANIIAKKLGKPVDLIKHTKDRAGHDLRYAINHAKITRELGWKPSVSFEEGIEKTIKWYQENKDWWEPISRRAEEIAEKYLNSKVKSQNLK